MVRITLALAALALATSACSTLPNRYATGDDEEAGLVDLKEYVGEGTGERATASAGAPGQTDVAWEDNGRPIRELTPDPRPEEMKLPTGMRPSLAPPPAASGKAKKAKGSKSP